MQYICHGKDFIVLDGGTLPVIPYSVDRTEIGLPGWTADIPLENKCYLGIWVLDDGTSWMTLNFDDLELDDDFSARIMNGHIEILNEKGLSFDEKVHFAWRHDIIDFDDIISLMRQIGRMEVIDIGTSQA